VSSKASEAPDPIYLYARSRATHASTHRYAHAGASVRRPISFLILFYFLFSSSNARTEACYVTNLYFFFLPSEFPGFSAGNLDNLPASLKGMKDYLMKAEQFKKIDPVVSVYCKVCTFPVLFSFCHYPAVTHTGHVSFALL
jgi:hypothetical protein